MPLHGYKHGTRRSKTHKRLKERFLIGRNRTKCANFRGSPKWRFFYLFFSVELCHSSGNCQETETCMFRPVTCHDNLSKTILQGTLEDERRSGRQRKCWMARFKEWTSLLMLELLAVASCRKDWKRISDKSSVISVTPDDPIGRGTELN